MDGASQKVYKTIIL